MTDGPGPNVPFVPPTLPWLLPQQPFEAMIAKLGARFLWLKAHDCPCSMGSDMPGSPDPQCQTCQGKGIYWDNPVGPWMGLLTFMHMAPSPDEPGQVVDTSFGTIVRGEPTMTIPYTAASGVVWEQASENDAFVEIDASVRFQANLEAGRLEVVPFQQGLSIAASGAVTTYDTVNHVVMSVSGYTVSGATVKLPASYPTGTMYAVEFYANPIYVAFRRAGGIAHVRPFGGSQGQLPRRFRLQPLDIWLRARGAAPNSNTPQSIGT
jgi:hypothetical protein